MRITGVELTLFKPSWDDAYGPAHERVQVALRIHTDDGATGIARTWLPQAGPIRDLLAPVLIGEDPLNYERLWARLEAVTVPLLGQERTLLAAIGALDVALWDLRGHILGRPCWQLLGGFRDWVDAYADIPIRSRTPAGLAGEVAAVVDQGFRAVKFHILSPDPDQVVAEALAARAAVGPDVKLMIDIFRAFDPATALAVARRLEEVDPFWLEEPVRWHDQPLGLALVARGTRIAIAGGEGECTLYGCRAIVEQGGVSYLQANVVGAGGYTPWLKIAGLAAAHHVKIAPHGAAWPEINAHLVAAQPHGVIVPATTPGLPPEVWARLYTDFAIRDGRIQLTDQPGLGLAFDEDFLRRHRVADG
ncbi:MAG: mandelate racemase/muconate lactonizing enzyme family protein [Chloroflexi bacterium]|nr:mandelate racemase/muconate lactonizing enzyme family protein [Chloroflexota bacterium]